MANTFATIGKDLGSAASAGLQSAGGGTPQTFAQRKGKAREQGNKKAKETLDTANPGYDGAVAGTAKHGKKNVKKTGTYKLHKGERVLTKKQAKKSRQKKEY